MCGLSGIITENKLGFYTKDKETFKQMLIVNSLRGSHSTGVFTGQMNDRPAYAKAVGNPFDFLDQKQTEPIFNYMISKGYFIVGHGRHATRGMVNGQNAHPFQVESITMAHNGTVFSSDLINVNKHSVDSLAICHALAENKAEDVFRDIDGAFAIVYHDSKDNTLNFVRNKDRPLHFAFDKKKGQMLFSSEAATLKLIGERNDYVFDNIFLLEEHVIYTFQGRSLEYTTRKVPYKARVIPIKQPPAVYTPPIKDYGQKWKTTKITSRATGLQLSLGEKIRFQVEELVEINTKQRIFQVFGKMVGYPETEVCAIYKGGDLSKLTKGVLWEGKISSFSEASKRQALMGVLHTTYVNDLSLYNHTLVETLDGTHISKADFAKMAATGCDYCNSKIEPEDVSNCLVDDTYIFCPACSATFLGNEQVTKEL